MGNFNPSGLKEYLGELSNLFSYKGRESRNGFPLFVIRVNYSLVESSDRINRIDGVLVRFAEFLI